VVAWKTTSGDISTIANEGQGSRLPVKKKKEDNTPCHSHLFFFLFFLALKLLLAEL
jgi:hypothetical protein